MPDQFNPDPLLLPGRSPADPAQAAGFLGGGAASFLGVPEAVQALRGQMTPEEAQQFALLAGMSMVPGMRGEGMAAKGLAKEWGPVAARIAATTGKEGAAWHPTTQYPFTETPNIAYSPDPGMQSLFSKNTERVLADVGKIGTDADDPYDTYGATKKNLGYIQAYKNAGQDQALNAVKQAGLGGPSSPWKPTDPKSQIFPEHITTMDVPDYLPTPIPERAKAAGFNIPLAHGTKSETPFEEFALPEEVGKFGGRGVAEIGPHAGSPKAANRFGGHELYSMYNRPRVYPLVMRAQNLLETPDLGSWGPSKIANYLKDHPEFGGDAVSNALLGKKPVESTGEGAVQQIQALRDLIRSKGYDSIKYKNQVEDPDHISYIALDPKQLRSPWAAFKDLDSRNLLAGLAGGAVAAPALTSNVQDYVKALNK